MLVASLHDVTSHYGAQAVLRGVSFKIESGQKLGLIGANGSGKTTVLRILLGQEQPTGGTVAVTPGARVGYVPQYAQYEEEDTVLDSVLTEHQRLASALRKQEERLAQAPDMDMDRALRAYQRARDDYDRVDGDLLPQRARTMLSVLGLEGKEAQRTGSLSGGEKNVLSLTRALLAEPDLLVLDEPANHLDYVGVAWLEDFLRRFKGRC